MRIQNFICHRVNWLEDLETRVLPENGAEIDVRMHEGRLVLKHDAVMPRDELLGLEEFLSTWGDREGLLVVEFKDAHSEAAIFEALKRHGVRNWFALSTYPPVLCLLANRIGELGRLPYSAENLSVRYSEHEPVEHALSLAGKIGWVWIDCFSKLPLDRKIYEKLKDAGYRICLVSPELQGHPLTMIEEFKAQLEGLVIDAVCTKRPDLWGQAQPAEVLAALENFYPISK